MAYQWIVDRMTLSELKNCRSPNLSTTHPP